MEKHVWSAFTAISWRAQQLPKTKSRQAAEIARFKSERAFLVRQLAEGDINPSALSSLPADVITHLQMAGLQPFEEMLRLYPRRVFSSSHFALIAAGRLAQEMADDLHDDDADRGHLLAFVARVEECYLRSSAVVGGSLH